MFRRSLPLLLLALPLSAEPLPGTKPLTRAGDLPAQTVAGIDAYLTRLRAETEKTRPPLKLDESSPEAFEKSAGPHREKLRKMLGVVDARLPVREMELVGGVGQSALVAETNAYKVFAVRWPVLPGVDGEGLLLEPKGKIVAQLVLLPDADQTPEQLAGLAPGLNERQQTARNLAGNAVRVVVPVLINRDDRHSGSVALNRWTNQPHREFIYRMAYEMGRHVLGYEVQKVLGVVDWFTRERDALPVFVEGYGEGGLIALYSGALDSRIRGTSVLGATYGQNQPMWEQPIYRNVWQFEREFSVEDLRTLCRVSVESRCFAPEVTGPPAPRDGRRGAAPGKIVTPEPDRAEISKLAPGSSVVPGTVQNRYTFWQREPSTGLFTLLKQHKIPQVKEHTDQGPPVEQRKNFDPAVRHERQFRQLVDFTQKVMRDSEAVRQREFWKTLDVSNLDAFAKSTAGHRERLHDVIGKLPAPTVPPNPQTRQIYDEAKWTGYEVTLDVYPDVFAYGILLLPKGLKPGEKRPVVVCQHGLEGTPRSCIDPEVRPTYARFAARLADEGYIVYCPQNPYLGRDLFRVLQRKANPLGLSLFSFIIRQHERTLDWLATLPNVDAERLAFYGLSYGGKTAMRVPAILPRYCLSICSGDFNEWIWKNVSVDYTGSYMFTLEYEMPEFDLGNTFNYAEMAALIAPRPFMVERGHDDGVGIDEWVAYEYAKVRRLFSRLKLAERTTIEFFAGVHEIKLVGTLQFLKDHVPLKK